jgi:hypothetical protein
LALKALPRQENAPIIIHGGGSLSTLSDLPPPILETIDPDFDRHGSLETTGLDVYRQTELEARTVVQARSACPCATVGYAIVVFPESRPTNVNSPITLFNGPVVNGDHLHFLLAYLRSNEAARLAHAASRAHVDLS